MARKPRIHFPGACYHVILRGNGGQDIFFNDEDQIYFFTLIQEGVERYRHRVHCYCLMSNHIHLVIQVKDIPLSRIIQNVSFRYTRYIHNNPVRVSLVTQPYEYSWSSHNKYLNVNVKQKPPWLTIDFVLKMFADNRNQAIAFYDDFIQKGVNEKYRKVFSKGSLSNQFLGDDSFVEKAYELASFKQTYSPTIKKIIWQVCKEYKVTSKELRSGSKTRHLTEARAMCALLVRDTQQLTLTDLGKELQRDLSGLSQAANRLYLKTTEGSEIAAMLQRIYEGLKTP